MPGFQNRERELEVLCSPAEPLLANIYGEAGIGKTSLLAEAAACLRERLPACLILSVSLDPLVDPPDDRPRRLLQALVDAAGGVLRPVQDDPAVGAEEIVTQLNASPRLHPVLMLDNTEVLQEDATFWQWLETAIVVPLLLAGYVRQVFAGRVPAPWREFQARSRVRLLRLAPLPAEPAPPRNCARRLVSEVFREQQPALLEAASLPELVEMVLGFSCGHPLLSIRLAGWVAQHWPLEVGDDLRERIADEVVRRFIDEVVFEDIEASWREILWWASILDWFDTTTLRRYLGLLAADGRVRAGLVREDWDSFFIRGIHRLRLLHTIVSWEEEGYRLYGVIRDIVRQCLAAADREGYVAANLRAADMIDSLAGEFEPDEEEYLRYRQQAHSYRDLIAQEVTP